jgi:uncharacterized protein YxjI
MKLYIKQKVFALKARFNVKDESGADRFSVEGDFFSLKSKLHIYDMTGSEVAVVYRRLMTFLPRFVVEIGGVQAAEIVKEFSFFIPKYHLEGTALRLEGDLMAHQYMLGDGTRTVMSLSKEWFTWGDSYLLDIENPADEILALSIALAVDCVLAAQKSRY